MHGLYPGVQSGGGGGAAVGGVVAGGAVGGTVARVVVGARVVVVLAVVVAGGSVVLVVTATELLVVVAIAAATFGFGVLVLADAAAPTNSTATIAVTPTLSPRAHGLCFQTSHSPTGKKISSATTRNHVWSYHGALDELPTEPSIPTLPSGTLAAGRIGSARRAIEPDVGTSVEGA